MDQPKPAPQPTHRGQAFNQMKPRQKVIWIIKVTICVLTFGFLFPWVMYD